MKYYIASKLENAPLVREMRDLMKAAGHEITYDWTIQGSVRGDAQKLTEVADDEARGVKNAHVVIVLLPGGRGTHVELGIALGLGVPVVMWNGGDPALTETGEQTCAFYHHPLVRVLSNLGDLLTEVELRAPRA